MTAAQDEKQNALELSHLQRYFSQSLFGAADKQLMAQVQGANAAEKTQRLSVYSNNVNASLSAALADLYPVIERLVGRDFFRAMAREYIQQYPPRQASLIFYGEYFPSFLAGFEPAQSLPYLADVARLELATHQAYHAADQQSLSAQQLAGLAPEQIMRSRVQTHGSTRLLQSAFPFYSIWQNHRQQEPSILDLDQGGENLLVIRPAFEVRHFVLDDAQSYFAEQIIIGNTLADAIESAMEKYEDFDPAQTLAELIQYGLFVTLNTLSNPYLNPSSNANTKSGATPGLTDRG